MQESETLLTSICKEAKLNSCQFLPDPIGFCFLFKGKSKFRHCTAEVECITLDKVLKQDSSRAVFSMHIHAGASA